jgi:hypothetical protein
VGSTIPTVESQQPFSEMATLRGVDIEEPEANNVDPVWRSLHRNTLENLLRVIVRYYRGLYLFPALHLQKPFLIFFCSNTSVYASVGKWLRGIVA